MPKDDKLDPDIFPQRCAFKIIARDEDTVQTLIKNTLRDMGLNAPLTQGRSSSSGHYISLSFVTVVDSQDHMRGIVAELSRVDGVKVVL